ncbi:MAG: hypothetical protein AABY54_07160 [Deltaproteobacteria bacterium]
MNLRKLSSLLLISLILNLNMVVPAVSYAAAEETCSCHLSNADRQCHCEEGCKSCGMHKSSGQWSGVRGQLKAEDSKEEGTVPDLRAKQSEAVESGLSPVLKGRTCSTSPQGDSSILPVSAIPFMVPVFCNAVPMLQVSNLSLQSENTLHVISIAPSEKPPAA